MCQRATSTLVPVCSVGRPLGPVARYRPDRNPSFRTPLFSGTLASANEVRRPGPAHPAESHQSCSHGGSLFRSAFNSERLALRTEFCPPQGRQARQIICRAASLEAVTKSGLWPSLLCSPICSLKIKMIFGDSRRHPRSSAQVFSEESLDMWVFQTAFSLVRSDTCPLSLGGCGGNPIQACFFCQRRAPRVLLSTICNRIFMRSFLWPRCGLPSSRVQLPVRPDFFRPSLRVFFPEPRC